jgi:hypothetical protein
MKTKKETIDFAIKYLNVFFESNGFKKTKRLSGEFVYQRKTEFGYDGFACDTLGYDSYRLRFSVFKRDIRIEDICKHILKNTKSGLPIDIPIDEDSISMAFTYDTTGLYAPDMVFPECFNEIDIKKECESICDFMENKAFPLLNKTDDLRAIDKIVNQENFWETDWLMPFNLGNNFHLKRLIIARLSGNLNFEEIIEKNYNVLEKLSRDSGDNFIFNRNDLSRDIPFAVEYLKKTEPLYS